MVDASNASSQRILSARSRDGRSIFNCGRRRTFGRRCDFHECRERSAPGFTDRQRRCEAQRDAKRNDAGCFIRGTKCVVVTALTLRRTPRLCESSYLSPKTHSSVTVETATMPSTSNEHDDPDDGHRGSRKMIFLDSSERS